jgi:O-antigen/teichoic acid export membrane protein
MRAAYGEAAAELLAEETGLAVKSSIDDKGFASRVRSAVFWRSGSQIVAQMVMWGSTILVVRLLDPHDYGLFAMSQVVLVLLNFLNGYSFASSLIQAESLDRHRISQIFGLLILLNGGLATVQWFAAPLAASYFRQPMVADMLRVQALLYLPTPFIALPSALLARGLDFKKQGMANLAGALAGALTALGCALSGLGVWTLVIAPITLFTVRAIGLTIAAKLLVWPSFRFAGAGDVLRFGGALLLAQFFWIIQSQADIFIAGRALDPHHLGLYAEALFLTLIFTGKFIPPLNEVAFPAYAQLAKEGGDIGEGFVTTAKLTMFAALPLYAGMAVTAQPLVETMFGAKWLEMSPLVALLALAMPFFTLQIVCSPATNALGRPNIYALTNGIGAIIMPVSFMIGISYGVMGLAYAWLVAAPLLMIVTLSITLPAIGVSFRHLFRALTPGISAAIAMAGLVRALDHSLPAMVAPARLGLLAAVGAATYFTLLYLVARPALAEMVMLITRRTLPQPRSA